MLANRSPTPEESAASDLRPNRRQALGALASAVGIGLPSPDDDPGKPRALDTILARKKPDRTSPKNKPREIIGAV